MCQQGGIVITQCFLDFQNELKEAFITCFTKIHCEKSKKINKAKKEKDEGKILKMK